MAKKDVFPSVSLLVDLVCFYPYDAWKTEAIAALKGGDFSKD
jgi:hypothetical protein